MSLEIKLHLYDGDVLEKVQSDFGGSLYYRPHDGCIRWRLNLGKGNTRSLGTASKLLSYMCLETKYNKLHDIVHYHKQLAETKREESERLIDSPVS